MSEWVDDVYGRELMMCKEVLNGCKEQGIDPREFLLYRISKSLQSIAEYLERKEER